MSMFPCIPDLSKTCSYKVASSCSIDIQGHKCAPTFSSQVLSHFLGVANFLALVIYSHTSNACQRYYPMTVPVLRKRRKFIISNDYHDFGELSSVIKNAVTVVTIEIKFQYIVASVRCWHWKQPDTCTD